MMKTAIFFLLLLLSGGVPWELPLVIAVLAVYALKPKQIFIVGIASGLTEDILTGRTLGLTAMVFILMQLVIYVLKEQLTLKSVFYLAASVVLASIIYRIILEPPLAMEKIVVEALLAGILFKLLRIQTTPREVYLK